MAKNFKSFNHNQKLNVAQINQKLNQLSTQMKAANNAGDYQNALKFCLQAMTIAPQIATIKADATAICCYLHRWDDAIKYGLEALKKGSTTYQLYDGLAHAYGAKHDFENCQKYGNLALTQRLEIFGKDIKIPHNVFVELPAKPNINHKDRNIVAFSLFGKLPKYCEGAIHNAQMMQSLYPDWRAVFYVDESVPKLVLEQLAKANAKIIFVNESQKRFPGPMWRFFALNLDCDRVIFRGVDSLISNAEVATVNEWIDSDKHFHIIRDGASHTELILAGLWGAITKALPNIDDLLELFIQEPLQSEHFADQFFLREFVYPYVKQSVLQHDSKFKFGDYREMPIKTDYQTFHIGMTEALANMNVKLNQFNDETIVVWSIFDNVSDEKIMEYENVVRNGEINISVPAKIALMLQNKTHRIEFKEKT